MIAYPQTVPQHNNTVSCRIIDEPIIRTIGAVIVKNIQTIEIMEITVDGAHCYTVFDRRRCCFHRELISDIEKAQQVAGQMMAAYKN